MQCVDDYTVEIVQEIAKPANNLLSNFLSSNSLFDVNDNAASDSNNNCDTVNCYSCGEGQEKDSNGNCMNI